MSENLEGFKINCIIHSSNEKLCVICQTNLDDLPQICKECWYKCKECKGKLNE